MFMLIFSGCKRKVLELHGRIESNEIEVVSEVSGIVLELNMGEGMEVQKEDVIVTISNEKQLLAINELETTIKYKETRLKELEKKQEEQLDEILAEIKIAEIDYQYWENCYHNYESLYRAGAVTGEEFSDIEYEYRLSQQKLKNLNDAAARLRLEQENAIDHSLAALELDLQLAMIELEKTKQELEKYRIRAPIKGTYLVRNVNIGDTVYPGTSIGVISNLEDLWVDVYVPQREINSVRPGQEVVLKSICLPGEKIKGKIVFVAKSAEFIAPNVDRVVAERNTVYRVRIKVMSHHDDLRPGMTVNVQIKLSDKSPE